MGTFTLNCSSDGGQQEWVLPVDMGLPHRELIFDSDTPRIGVAQSISQGPYVLTINSIVTNPPRITSSLLVTAESFLNQQTIMCSGSAVTIQFQGELDTVTHYFFMHVHSHSMQTLPNHRWISLF